MSERTEVRREADDALKQEIEWHRKHRKDVSGLSNDYKRGFIRGLRQARGTVNMAT